MRHFAALIIAGYAVAPLAAPLLLGCQQNLVFDAKSPDLIQVINVSEPFQVAVDEQGGDFLISVDDQPFRPIQWPTPRFGYTLAKARNLRLQAETESGRIVLTLLCEKQFSPIDQAWIGQAERLSNTVFSGQKAPGLAVQRLIDSAPQPRFRAGATNLWANEALWADDKQLAQQRFARASAEFSAIGDFTRAGFAAIAGAQLLQDRALFADSQVQLEVADALLQQATIATGAAYLSVRSANLRCQASERLANQTSDNIVNCWKSVVSAAQQIGEFDEAWTAAINIGYSLREQAKPQQALMLLRGLGSAKPGVSAFTLGQKSLLQGLLSKEVGLINQALQSFALAHEDFERSDSVAREWQASTSLQIAEIYRELGLFDSAYELFIEAINLYRADQQPERIASAMIKLAGIDAANANPTRAREFADRAASIYRRLGMRDRQLEAELAALETQSESKERQAARLSTLQSSALPLRLRARLQLMRANVEIARGEYVSAQKTLGAIQSTDLTPVTASAFVQSKSTAVARSGDRQKARGLLEKELARLMRRARAADNPTLGFLIARLGLPLQQQWVDLAVVDRLPVVEFWRVLALSEPMFAFLPRNAQPQPTKPSSATNLRSSRSERAMLHVLQRTAQRPRSAEMVTQAALDYQTMTSALPRGVWLMILMPGSENSAVLWLNRDRSELSFIAGALRIRTLVRHLESRTQSPGTAIADVQRAADALSTLLFDAAPIELKSKAADSELWVLHHELIAGMPLPLLRLNPTAILADQMPTSWVSQVAVATVGRMPKTSAPSSLMLLATGGDSQQRLMDVRREAALIQAPLLATQVELRAGSKATRTALQQGLLTPGAWLHVGAHGTSKVGLLGRSGVWLAPESQTARNAIDKLEPLAQSAGDSALPSDPTLAKPLFTSWFDLIDHRLHAELLVLNACDLAPGHLGYRGASLDFALALSAAGIANVVAANRPISDTASATWLPHFYQALQQSPAEIARALRTSQTALRQSRAFRHPFYWAALTHYRRFEVPTQRPL